MNKHFVSLMIMILTIAMAVKASDRTAVPLLKLQHLRTEYKENPSGIHDPAPRLSWEILAQKPNTIQTAYEIRCGLSEQGLREGKVLWSSGKVSSDQSNQVPYAGPELKSATKVWWQVKVWDNHGQESDWSEAAWWETGLLSAQDWKARWIEPPFEQDLDQYMRCLYFRKDFKVKANIRSAKLFITAHGLYFAELNGQRVSEDLFTPGWTSYNKRLQYQVYDLSDRLQKGPQSLGVIVGSGWYMGVFGFREGRHTYGDTPGVLAQLEIVYENGRKEIITTDDSWKVNSGPIISSEIYHGETYDARLEMPGWSQAGFDDQNWLQAIEAEHPVDHLVGQEGPPVRRQQRIKPVKIFTAPNGETLVDMGQNMVGWIELKVKGERGNKVTIKHAEVLDQEGNLYTANLRSAKQLVEYILKGGEEEVFEPHFTFQGFRYLSVSGYPGALTPESLTGIVIHSAMTPSGTFACSDPMLTQLQQNIVWGLKGNFVDVPTDCPQRNERMGWTGDAQVFAPTACFNMDAASFYTKWLRDVAADQHKDGLVPHVIPDVIGGGAATGWADVAVILPWTLYERYGDTRILEQQYESMKAWVMYMKKQAGDKYLWTTGDHFGDWLAFATTRSDYPGATTEKDFLATAYFAYSTKLLAKTAAVLGKKADSEAFNELFANIKTAFQNEFITPNGRLSPHTQTAYVLALQFGLIPDKLIDQAAGRLAEDVNKFGHITTGFLGASGINPMLSKYGYWDEAFKLLLRKDYPSWLYPITRGATTIWERWDGIKPDGSFQDVGMNSFNHYAYGAIGNWMYENIAGIQLDSEHPGYKHFIIKPHPGGGLDWARASYRSIYGDIVSSWTLENQTIIMQVEVPANTTATVYVPDGGKYLMQTVGSGSHQFTGRLK